MFATVQKSTNTFGVVFNIIEKRCIRLGPKTRIFSFPPNDKV